MKEPALIKLGTLRVTPYMASWLLQGAIFHPRKGLHPLNSIFFLSYNIKQDNVLQSIHCCHQLHTHRCVHTHIHTRKNTGTNTLSHTHIHTRTLCYLILNGGEGGKARDNKRRGSRWEGETWAKTVPGFSLNASTILNIWDILSPLTCVSPYLWNIVVLKHNICGCLTG